jgi:hypothetical protein
MLGVCPVPAALLLVPATPNAPLAPVLPPPPFVAPMVPLLPLAPPELTAAFPAALAPSPAGAELLQAGTSANEQSMATDNRDFWLRIFFLSEHKAPRRASVCSPAW